MASVIEPERLEQIRTNAAIETENISQKKSNFRPRFGLFHQPPYVSNLDGYKDVPFNHRVGFTKAPPGPLKGTGINHMKKGKNDDVLFSAPGYNGIGDTYVDPDKLMRFSYVNGTNTAPEEFKAWKTNDDKKTVIEPPYPYMSDVPNGEQGAAIRNIRGKQLHDKVVSQKGIGGAVESPNGIGRRHVFKFGAKNTSHPFSLEGYQGDNFENKKEKRRREQSEHRAAIHSGPFKAKTNVHEPFQHDSTLYDNARYDKGDCKLPECHDALKGTRFSKTQSNRVPWRPNNPAKQGFNKTLNKQHYYHQALYYKPRDHEKYRDEKIWIPNYRGTLEKPQPSLNKFYRNGRVRHTSQGISTYNRGTQLLG